MTAPADSRARGVAKSPRLCLPTLPAWVEEALGRDAVEEPAVLGEGTVVRIRESFDLTLLRASVPRATALDESGFRLATQRIYCAIGAILRARGRSPLRFWNYLPDIRRPTPDGLSRYEVFNAGRYVAFQAWYGTDAFGERLAPATSVGHLGPDLVVHVLASSAPAARVENPRQRPAYRYSRRYGPLPPCFARATLLDRPLPPHGGARSAIVSGTGSIAGEDTQHPGDVGAQLHETLLNLAHVSVAAAGERTRRPGGGLDGDAFRALSRYRDLRAYVVRDEDAEEVVAGLRQAFPELRRLEVASAELCRSELLVEVEGILSADA